MINNCFQKLLKYIGIFFLFLLKFLYPFIHISKYSGVIYYSHLNLDKVSDKKSFFFPTCKAMGINYVKLLIWNIGI
jgi:hypothetical protein